MRHIEIAVILFTLVCLFASCGKVTENRSTVLPSANEENTVTATEQTITAVNTTTSTVSHIFTTITSTTTSSSHSATETQMTIVTVNNTVPEATIELPAITTIQPTEAATEAQNDQI